MFGSTTAKLPRSSWTAVPYQEQVKKPSGTTCPAYAAWASRKHWRPSRTAGSGSSIYFFFAFFLADDGGLAFFQSRIVLSTSARISRGSSTSMNCVDRSIVYEPLDTECDALVTNAMPWLATGVIAGVFASAAGVVLVLWLAAAAAAVGSGSPYSDGSAFSAACSAATRYFGLCFCDGVCSAVRIASE